ncbi:MAG TPA: hypothetical protein PKM88_08375, partial [bacterium]|nr:hypothetical protein [bacterium]
ATCGNMLIMFPALVAALLWRRPENWGRAVAWLCFGLMLVLGPIGLRNMAMDSEPVFLASSWGLNLYIGNNANADATLAIRPGYYWEQLCAWPDQASGRSLGSVGRQRFYVQQVEQWALAHPLDFLALQGVKLFRFLRGWEQMRNIDPYFVAGQVPLLDTLLWRRAGISFPSGLIIPFALVGIVTLRSRWRALLPWLLFLGCFSLSVIAFFVVSRYRAPLLPFLIPAAWHGAAAVGSSLRAQSWRLPLAALILLLLANAPFPAVPSADPHVTSIRQEQIDWAEAWRHHGDLELRRGRLASAMLDYLTGQLRTGDPLVTLKYASVVHQYGNFALAGDIYRRVIAATPDLAVAAANLRQLEQDSTAAAALQAAIGTRPPVLADVQRALDQHLPGTAAALLTRITISDSMQADVTLLRLEISYQRQEFGQVAAAAGAALRRWPDDYRFHLQRGWARLAMEQYVAAGDDIRRAYALAPHEYVVQQAVLTVQDKGGIWPRLLEPDNADSYQSAVPVPGGDSLPHAAQ